MKKFNCIFALLLVIVALSFQSCKDEEEQPENNFAYGNKKAMIGNVWGGYVGESPTPGVFGSAIFITENTLTWHYNGGFPDSISGKGDILIIEFTTSQLMGLPSGKYTYSSNINPPFYANTFGMESFMIINYDSNNDEGDEVEFNGGTIDVTQSGDEYELKLNINTKANTTITGYYKGKITMYDIGKKKSVWLSTLLSKPLNRR